LLPTLYFRVALMVSAATLGTNNAATGLMPLTGIAAT
jgi:hypothetical protein